MTTFGKASAFAFNANRRARRRRYVVTATMRIKRRDEIPALEETTVITPALKDELDKGVDWAASPRTEVLGGIADLYDYNKESGRRREAKEKAVGSAEWQTCKVRLTVEC